MKVWAAFLVLFLIVASTGCSHKADRTWKVFIMGGVSNIKPSAAHSDRVNYILRQTHEPLFRFDENNRVISRVLKKWSRSENFRQFQLCPKENVYFDQNQRFEIHDIENSVVVAWKGIATPKFIEKNGCLEIDFLKPRFDFFETLSSFSTAPSRTTDNQNFDIGLGPFKVSKFGPHEIVLFRKIANSHKRFDRIVLKPIEGLSDEQLNDHSVQEFNLISQNITPSWVPKEYQAYPNSNLKAYVLVINVPDLRLRRAIYNCLDVTKLRNAFFHPKSPRDIGSLFPIGIKGAVPEKVHQLCTEKDFKMKKPLVFLNWKPKEQNELVNLFDELQRKTGVKIASKISSLSELSHDFIDVHSGYDLAIIYVQNEFSDMADFLEIFVDPAKIVHSLKFPALKLKFDEFKNTADPDRREKLGIELNNEILKQAIALPLFQPVRHIYYPKDIKLPQVGSTFNTFPEVDQIQ